MGLIEDRISRRLWEVEPLNISISKSHAVTLSPCLVHNTHSHYSNKDLDLVAWSADLLRLVSSCTQDTAA